MSDENDSNVREPFLGMKIHHDSARALRFEGSVLYGEHPLDLVSRHGVLIRPVESSGRICIMIEVGEDATSDDLRHSIPLAIAWRDRLLEYQGPWTGGGDNDYLEGLSRMQEWGRSYSVLASRLNVKIAGRLRKYVEFLRAYESAKASLKTWGDYWDWQYETKNYPYDIDHARSLLLPIRPRLGEKGANAILAEGIRRIQAGDNPFPPNFPITKQHVIDRLKAWRRGKKHRLIQAKEAEALQALRDGDGKSPPR